MDVPVYLFTGFLEAGKTKFIEETLEDSRFNNGERTLLLLCEQGENDYTPERFSGENVFICPITADDLTAQNLEKFRRDCKAERVIIEYNGMWQMRPLFDNLPKKWIIAQEFMFADSNTFSVYNSNMRSLVFDKLSTCELVVFNRFNDGVDKMELHKIVRGVNRRCSIAYEKPTGEVEYDDIKDPLPFDINAELIEIRDTDYALWYRDLTEELEKYRGKKIKTKVFTAKNNSLPNDCFVIGRPVMTCCVDDIQFAGLVCEYKNAHLISPKSWIIITAEIEVKPHKAYKGGVGPVLKVIDTALSGEPAEPVATFY